MISLPRGDEYNIAVQNPQIAFVDIDLKNSSVEITPLGLPKPYSGGFTITYKLSKPPKKWAVRCFHRDIQDLQQRYYAIENFLSKNQSRYFVEAKYLSNGIKINGKDYPIIKMDWLDGEPLNIYLNKVFLQKTKIENLLIDFVNLITELERLGIAHGDLQHGNIIVNNNKLHLIDYDGMYLPELNSLKTNEIGHVNYQHPNRTSIYYDKDIDRFSVIVIYIGLKAMSINTNLWKKYDNSENILFRYQDYADPNNSRLIHDLLIIPEIRPLIERFIGCCHLEFTKIPSLKDFLEGNFKYDIDPIEKNEIIRNQYEIIDAKKSGSIIEHFGEKVEIVGKISDKYEGVTFNGLSFMFLNFGAFPNQTFTLVLWQEAIKALLLKGISPASLVNKYVSVTGVISSYEGKPQMVIELPTQIQFLSGEDEANKKLNFNSTNSSPNPITRQRVNRDDFDYSFFNTLYENLPVDIPLTHFQEASKPVSSHNSTPPQHGSPTTPLLPPKVQNSKRNYGCLVYIILMSLGAIIFGAATESFDGLIAGIFLGGIIGRFFS